MMVETILESSQDFGMSPGALPQWKRELLQRRLARARPPPAPAPAPPPPPPPPPPPAPDDDEELRYGPGIVKRLKSRYLSLALRDAPRRRPSVLRRAASLEHLLDERPPPAPRAPRPPRPASLAAAPPGPAPAPARRDLVKRARSVDALSRLEAPPSPPPTPRAPRPPRRPQPLLRDAERPPPDVVRSTLRKFESAPPRRAAPPARGPAVLRALESRRSPTPEGVEPRSPVPSPEPVAPPDEPPSPSPPTSPVPEPPRSPPPPVPLEEAAPPSPPRSPAPSLEPKPAPAPRVAPPPCAVASPRIVRASPSPAASTDEVEGAGASCGSRRVSRAALEEIARAGCSVRYAFGSPRAGACAAHLPPLGATNPVLVARGLRRVGVIRPMPAAERSPLASPSPPPAAAAEGAECAARVNGHSTPEPGASSRIGAAGIERAWSGSAVKAPPAAAPWARGGAGGGAGPRGRAPPAPATSVVFNFSNRKEVPDYIENDGIILRASRRTRFKTDEPGVVVLHPRALCLDTDGEGEGEGEGGEWEGEGGPPSPCDVRFVNDNVLINGKSSMPSKHNRDRIAKLKLQFDDSLTRTFEYPSETSLCEEPAPCLSPSPSPAPAPAPAPAPPGDNSAALADNTHIASAALSRYSPSAACAAAFQLGVAPRPAAAPPHHSTPPTVNGSSGGAAGEGGEEGGDARPCGADLAKSWSDARQHHTDLLF